MTKRTRRNHSGSFKAKVAVAALRGDKTLTELAEQYQVHATQVTEWKRQLLERAADVFDGVAKNNAFGIGAHPLAGSVVVVLAPDRAVALLVIAALVIGIGYGPITPASDRP